MATPSNLKTFRDQWSMVASYLDAPSDRSSLKALARTSKFFNSLCNKDEFTLAKERIQRLFPQYENYKPTDMSYYDFYHALKSPRGFRFAYLKGLKEGTIPDGFLRRTILIFGNMFPATKTVKRLDILMCSISAGPGTYFFYYGGWRLIKAAWNSEIHNLASVGKVFYHLPYARKLIYPFAVCYVYMAGKLLANRYSDKIETSIRFVGKSFFLDKLVINGVKLYSIASAVTNFLFLKLKK